jgi:hypothetical protein
MRPTATRHLAIGTASRTSPSPKADSILIALGCDSAFIADLLGDLREEYATRAARDGRVRARLWYMREMIRSTPHVAWSALRDGTPATRTRLVMCLLAGIATLMVVTIAWMTRNGPPARLVNVAARYDGIVVNHVGPVQFSTTVLDAAGHHLKRNDVRYQRVSGIPIPVSIRGVVKCTERGNVLVRATLGALKTDFLIHCEPVRTIRGAGWGNFVLGQPARTLGVDAIGLDGQPVTRIAGTLRVDDSTVTTLNGSQLRPLRPGSTSIDITIGDHKWVDEVTVFEPVRTFEGLRPDQRWVVVAPVHLTRGASLPFALPNGVFFLAFGADSSEMPTTTSFRALGSSSAPQSPIRLTVAGPITCTPMGVLHLYCHAREPGATLTLERSRAEGPEEIVGMLVLERQEQH